MAKRRTRSQRPGAPTLEISAPEPSVNRETALPVEEPTHGYSVALTIFHIVCLTTVVLAMTPWTHNLDDIKVKLFLSLGPLLMLAALGAIALGVARGPHPIPGWALAGFGAVILLSTLLSEYSWAGWFQVLFFWSAFGFFVSGVCIGSNRRTSRWFFKYLVIQLLVVNLIGYFMFDLTGSPDHGSLVAHLFRFLFEDGRAVIHRDLYNLFYTLMRADGSMQSTILNRDFFAGFCVLYLPLAMCLALDPDSRRWSIQWRVVATLTVVLTLMSIFLCRSKGEWIFGAIVVVLFFIMWAFAGKGIAIDKRHLVATVGGIAILLATLGWMKSPTLFGQLKSLGYSIHSRSLIWFGSYNIWKEFPLFGGGPGTFRIHFPQFRAADYWTGEVSNVTLFSHNYFLDMICETGLIGFICFCVFLGSLMVGGFFWIRRHTDPHLRLRLAAVIAGIVGIFGSNLSSPNGRWVIGATSMWTVLGLLGGLWIQARGSEATQKGRSTRLRAQPGRFAAGATLLAGVLGLAILYPSFMTGKRYFESAKHYAQGYSTRDYAYTLLEDPRGGADFKKLDEMLGDAYEQFEYAIATDSTNMSAYYQKGSAYTTLYQINQQWSRKLRAAGSVKEAEDKFNQSIKYLLAAKQSYETLSQYWPDYAEIHYNLGIVYNAYANLLASELVFAERSEDETPAQFRSRARDHLERMGRLSTKPEVAEMRGQQYMLLGDDAKARDVYREGLNNDPDDREQAERLAVNLLGVGQRIGDREAIAEALLALWKQSPAEDWRLDQLLEMCEQSQLDTIPETTRDALDVTLEAALYELARINPIDPRVHAGRARLAQRHGDPDEVLAAVERYIKCGGSDPEILQLLTLDIGPNDPAALQARQRLEDLESSGANPQ